MIFNRNREPSFYEKEAERIQQAIQKETPGSEAYDKAVAELMKLQAFYGKEKEQKQFFTKEGRGNIIGKVVGFLGLGGLAFGLARFEKNGHLFTGSSNGIIGSIVKIGARLFG